MSPCYNPAGSLICSAQAVIIAMPVTLPALAVPLRRPSAAGEAHRVTMCLGSQVAMPGNT